MPMTAIKSYNFKPILPFLAVVLLSTPLLGLEKGTVFTQLNAIHRPSLDVFFKNITYLGDASYALMPILQRSERLNIICGWKGSL